MLGWNLDDEDFINSGWFVVYVNGFYIVCFLGDVVGYVIYGNYFCFFFFVIFIVFLMWLLWVWVMSMRFVLIFLGLMVVFGLLLRNGFMSIFLFFLIRKVVWFRNFIFIIVIIFRVKIIEVYLKVLGVFFG